MTRATIKPVASQPMSANDVAVAGDSQPPARQKHQILRAFRSSSIGVIGLVFLAVLIFFAIFGPRLVGQAAQTQHLGSIDMSPNWNHVLGTDALGRDVLARVIAATQLTLLAALAAAGIGVLIGVPLGALAALLRPRPRTLALRTIDTMLSFPAILVAIFISAIIGVGLITAPIAVGIAVSFSLARVTSTLAMSIAARDYVSAARVIGVRWPRLITRHILPNIAETLVLAASVGVALAVVTIAAISFLGFGVQPPRFDWGTLLSNGVQAIYIQPFGALGPAIALALTAIAFGFTGEALARALNPLLWAGRATGSRPSPLQAIVSNASSQPVQDLEPTVAHPAIEVKDLVVSFPNPTGRVNVVKGVSFYVKPGEVIGIVGESGSGKTMTSLALAHLTPYPGTVSGSIKLHGQELGDLSEEKRARLLGTNLAVVFQDPMSSLNPALRIGTQLTESPRAHRGLSRSAARNIAVKRLQEVHMPSAARQLRRYPFEFSGGMRQRAMIAMGLMNEPTLLIADEPTTALDVTIQAQIMELLGEVNRRRETAIILISHNLALVAQNCDRVLVMYAGRIVEELSADRLGSAKHPYTRALLRSVPDIEQPRSVPLIRISGEPPESANLPSGCAFHPRCPSAVERCRSELPELETRPDGTRVACHVANQEPADTSLIDA
jgi:peptide/nickel transport system ATP-binding protein/peptide/nickel transport system permease protein